AAHCGEGLPVTGQSVNTFLMLWLPDMGATAFQKTGGPKLLVSKEAAGRPKDLRTLPAMFAHLQRLKDEDR
ncbi:MAG TPA: hypothetical protein VF115_15665, partial [Acidimicrobiia bacterium]